MTRQTPFLTPSKILQVNQAPFVSCGWCGCKYGQWKLQNATAGRAGATSRALPNAPCRWGSVKSSSCVHCLVMYCTVKSTVRTGHKPALRAKGDASVARRFSRLQIFGSQLPTLLARRSSRLFSLRREASRQTGERQGSSSWAPTQLRSAPVQNRIRLSGSTDI